MNRIDKALNLAKTHFEIKLRQNGENYYEDHILKVFQKVKELKGTEDQQILAILHDMLEDTPVTFEYLKDDFGEKIAYGVKILTIDKSDESISKRGIKEFESVRLACEDSFTELVRFADRLSNLEQTSFNASSNLFISKMIDKTEKYYIPNFKYEHQIKLKKEVMRLKTELHYCPICYGRVEYIPHNEEFRCVDCKNIRY